MRPPGTTGPSGAPAPVKVLYVAGSGRSGSTILDRTLGQLDGFFSAGELAEMATIRWALVREPGQPGPHLGEPTSQMVPLCHADPWL